MSRNYRLNITLTALLFLLCSCSYTPNITQISEEDLADYNPKHFQYARSYEDKIENEDSMIMKAIFYEQQGEFDKSNKYYNELYDLTQNEEYMFREIRTALYIGKKSKNMDSLEKWTKSNPDSIKAKRILISFYLSEKKYDRAKALANELLSESSSPIDYELAANPYILTGEYVKAVEFLTKAYDKTYNAEVLIKISTLYANYIGDIDSAISRLEQHRQSYECDERICHQLLEIYTKQEKIEPLLDVYEELYSSTRNEQYAIKVVEGYMYKQEVDRAIEFLETDYPNDELLYELYLSKKDYEKAQKIAETIYSKSHDAKWLAESAMALYEKSADKNDKAMLDIVVQKFEKALNEGAKESVYLNYYGYTLIDKDIDVEKGVEIIKEALSNDPDNSYYLDSLAWGYYKLGHCKEAYVEMKKVVDTEGLNEEEIIEHWAKINECNQKK